MFGKKGKKEKVIPRRNLTKEELKEIVSMTALVNGEMWKAMQIAGNTALITKGQELAKQAEEVARVLLNAKNNFVSQLLGQCGVPAGQAAGIDLETGEIKDVKNKGKKKKLIKEGKLADDGKK